jgi:hypothetical protein
MADKSKHKPRGKKLGEFCAVAPYGKKCECSTPNNYRENGEPPWGQPYQAHHLLPVTCVNSELVSKPEIKGVLELTQWCINKKLNMYGMPIWGHTVKWYCRVAALKPDRAAPPWENIPQHLNDHDLYNHEVCQYLGGLAVAWEQADHKVKGDEIAGDLDSLGGMMQNDLLKVRGLRTSGTHNAWNNAIKESIGGGEHKDWYMPFSMAEDGDVRKRAFPIKGESNSVRAWIERIAGALRLK